MTDQKYVAQLTAKSLYAHVNPLLVRTVGQCWGSENSVWNEEGLLYVGYVELSRVYVDGEGVVRVNMDAIMKTWLTEWPEDHVEVWCGYEEATVKINVDRLSEGGLRLTNRPHSGSYVSATEVAVLAETQEALERFGGTMDMFADGSEGQDA